MIARTVRVIENVRTGMGEEYIERSFRCPECGKTIMYHNGIQIEYGHKQNFCDECGTPLWWGDIYNG